MAPQAEKLVRELTPTLIIGLGGTGKMVLTRLRARFEKEMGDVPQERVRLLELDIDPAIETARYDTHETRLREDEFLDLGEVPADQIIRQIQQGHYPEFAPWLDHTLSLHEAMLRRGGQQIPQLGRLAFIWHAGRTSERFVRKRLDDTIGALTSQYVADPTRPLLLNVFIISSLCGGTGRGMFIDAAYLLQRVLHERGIADKTSVTAFLATPRFFSAANQSVLRPNTWAALWELDYFIRTPTNRRKFDKMRYLRRYTLDITDRPYKIVYLIDAIDHRGYNIAQEEYMVRLFSDAIYLLTASRIGDEAASMINNVKATRDVARGTVYSTFGLASLVLPATEITTIAGARLMQQFVREEWLAVLDERRQRRLVQEVGDLEGRLGLNVTALHGVLTRDEHGPLGEALGRDSRLGRAQLALIAKEALHTEVTRRVELIRPEVMEDARQHMEQKMQRLVKALLQGRPESEGEPGMPGLHQVVARALGDPERGLRFAVEYLRRLLADLDSLWGDAEKEHMNAEGRLNAARSAEEGAANNFRAHARGGLFRRRPQRQMETCLRAVRGTLNREIDLRAYEQIKQLALRLKEVVGQLLKQLTDMQERLERLVTTTLAEDVRLGFQAIEQMDRVRRQPIVRSEEEINAICEPHWDDAMRALRQEVIFAQGGQFVRDLLTSDSFDTFHQMVWEAGRKVFIPYLAQVRVEDLIQEQVHRGEVTIPAVLEGLKNQAAYFWLTLTGEDVQAGRIKEIITVIGVEDETSSIFSFGLTEQGTSVVTTGNPHAMTVLKMAHGLAFDTLSQRDAYIGDYRNAMEEVEPIHVFPEFNLGFGEEGKKRRQLFAQAWAYGIIKNRLAHFYIPSEVGATAPSESGHQGAGEDRLISEDGLFEALWQVVHDDDLAKELTEAARCFEKEPKETLLKHLDAFAPRVPEEYEVREGWLADVLKDDVQAHRRRVEQHY